MKAERKIKFQIAVFLLTVLTVSSSFYYVYSLEKDDVLKGNADYNITYRYRLQNLGPLNLTTLNLRLAQLKTWEPVQTLQNLKIYTPANQTFSDEYNNTFSQYDFQNFLVNQTLDLRFDANLTVHLLDYTGYKFKIRPYQVENDQYKLLTQYHPLTDTTDLATLNTAKQLATSDNPVDIAYNAYNFTSTYLRYRLLATPRGSAFALRNGYGDCDEFTDLFLALIRAHGIPGVEHSAWLADFVNGFTTTDEGAAAHAYPMFYLEGYGFLPADPTRGNSDIFGNWLKTDEKRITLTRGPDQPYRSLKYRWVPVNGVSDPQIASNYTITVNNMKVTYFSKIRNMIFTVIIFIPITFVIYNLIRSHKLKKIKAKKIEKLLNPSLNQNK